MIVQILMIRIFLKSLKNMHNKYHVKFENNTRSLQNIMGSEQSQQYDNDGAEDLVREFLQLHCELCPDNDVTFINLTCAFHEFLNSKYNNVDYRKLLCTEKIIQIKGMI